jgi:type I restriction enzyme S subunit
MSFPRYAKYKDSGVEWLGQVPENWVVAPVNSRYSVQLGKMLDSARITGDHLRPYLRVFDVQWGSISTDELPLMDFDDESRAKFRLVPGDLLINEGGSYPGRSAIWDGQIEECYYQKALHRLRPRRPEADSSRFFYYVMHWASNFGVFVAGGNESTIEHLPAERLRRYRFAFPPIDEQFSIAYFLEREITKLNRLIDEQRRLIELLKEKRQAVISHAVTKGLNPHAPMKPSGIDWLGKVPAHWEVKTVRHACQIDNTLRDPIDKQTRMDIAGEYPYYGPTGILSWINDFRVEGEYFLIGEDGDHFLKFDRQPMTIYVEGRFNVNNHAHLVRGSGNCSTKWACIYFAHRDLLPWLIKQGVGRYKLRKETLVTIPILVPLEEEQKEILKQADLANATSRSLVAEAEQAIDLLQERRTALISAAVTGKIDVRGSSEPEAA